MASAQSSRNQGRSTTTHYEWSAWLAGSAGARLPGQACQSLTGTGVIGGQMDDAVAAFNPAELTFANDHAIALEVTRLGRSCRVIHEVDLAAQLSLSDPVAQFGGWLEQAGLGGVDVVIAAGDFHQAGGLVEVARCLIGFDDAGMGEQIAQALLDNLHPAAGDRSAAAEFTAQCDQAVFGGRYRGQSLVGAVGPDQSDGRAKRAQRGQ